jgi:UDP-N-acetylmuramate-alanine ligase
MRYHFISIGGSAMHSLALALHAAGHTVTGSDDALHEPSLSRLRAQGLAPESLGWSAEKVSAELDAVIVGMHSKQDNPELAKARELNLPVYSYPEFILKHAQQKQRVVIAGSHGKSTVTAMCMHVFQKLGYKFDYLVGAQVPGFESTVRLSDDAPFMLIEGDEYPASPLDPRAKFLVYDPHIVLLTGIAWDHMNVYPTEEAYLRPFEQLLTQLPKGCMVVWNRADRRVRDLVKPVVGNELYFNIPYDPLAYRIKQDKVQVRIPVDREAVRQLALEALRKLKPPKAYYDVSLYGEHNVSNLSGALALCRQFAVEPEEFLEAISDFTGAGLRLQTLHQSAKGIYIRDFAHAPSKVLASVAAVRERYPKHNLVAVLELHTYSSLNSDFLPQYRNSLKPAQRRIVLMDPHAAEIKQLKPPTPLDVRAAFGEKTEKDLMVLTQPGDLPGALKALLAPKDNVVLLMSSGSFGGVDLQSLLV